MSKNLISKNLRVALAGAIGLVFCLALLPAPAAALITEDLKLTASDGAAGDYFGNAIAVSGDTAIVGARFDNNSSGAAYVLVRAAGGTWSQQAKLTASDAAASDSFGASVSIDGDTAIVGAMYDTPFGYKSGSAYVFERDGAGTWSQVKKLTASDGSDHDHFGIAVAISGDVVLIGAGYDGPPAKKNSGSAYAFERDYGGVDNWGQKAKLTAPDGAADDYFGHFLALDGSTAILCAPFDDEVVSNSGSAYVFERAAGGTWSLQTKLTASNPVHGETLGYAVSMDGDTVVLGALHNGGGNQSGSAYVFGRDGGGTWSQQAKLDNPNAAAARFYGYSVSVLGDAAVVSAVWDNQNGYQSGSAYLFGRDEGGAGSWGLQDKLIASDGASTDHFGYAVAVTGDAVLIGAVLDDDKGSNSGSVYVYEPFPSDADGDGVTDPDDNCPNDPNTNQSDLDGDGVGDVCDPCFDGSKQCMGTYIQICSGNAWVTQTSCTYGCYGDGHCNSCAPSSKRCSGSYAQSCNATSTGYKWQNTSYCSYGCVGGSCNQCVPGTKRCSGTYAQSCMFTSTGYKWVNASS